MRPHIQLLTAKNVEYPSSLRDKKNRDLFPKIWALGDTSILKRSLFGFFCSVKCPGDLILRTYDLARALRDAGVPIISGFHSPIEKDCLDLLLRGSQPVVVCPARSIQNMRVSKAFRAGIEAERLVVLSPFEANVKRPTVETSQRRNQLVGALAAAVFVAYADRGGKMEEFCKAVLTKGKPLYTFESHYNKTVVDAGAKPIDLKKPAQWAGSYSDCEV
jgi:predicted Rossmann fold nucleotide-binding protein DprA/Smf involved in DNA uptake